MYCPRCGSPNDDAARFCMTCGVDMEPYRQGAQQVRANSPLPQEPAPGQQQPEPAIERRPPDPPAPPPPAAPAHAAPIYSAPAPLAVAEHPATEPSSSAAGASSAPGTELVEGLIPSRTQSVGYGLVELGAIGLFLLWAAQWYEGTMAGPNRTFGEGVFMATRGSDVLTMGWAFLGLLAGTMILLTGLALLPRMGLGFRVAGYVLTVIGAAGAVVGLWRGWIDDDVYLLLPFGAVILAGLFLVQKGTSSFQKEWKTRLGRNRPYRKRWLALRCGTVAGLWLLGLVGYVLLLVLDEGWTLQPGSYVGGTLLALGLIGAIAMLAGLKGRPSL